MRVSYLTKLPILSGQELIKILTKVGFVTEGQRGSHVKLKKRLEDRVIVTIVPLHNELDTGTLLGILKQAEISREEFFKLKETM